MDQRTHSWIALRAIALLADENAEPNLVALLLPHARQASVGAWIPDQADAKRGGASHRPVCVPTLDSERADSDHRRWTLGRRQA